MQSIKRMIDRAVVFCSTRTEVASRLGVAPQRLNDWESGRRSMPDEAIAALATIAGMELTKCLGAYHAERLEKKRAAASAGLAGAVFALAALAGGSDARAGVRTAACEATRYTLCALRRSMRGWLAEGGSVQACPV
jgi:transcriptional regulator with XRE-family HTH domain